MSFDTELNPYRPAENPPAFEGVSPLYCDYNATTPIPGALAAMARDAYSMHWVNQSASYKEAEQEARLARVLRQRFAGLLYDMDKTIICGSATEAINLAIYSLARNLGDTGHLLISDLEHAAVKNAARAWFGDRLFIVSTPRLLNSDFSEISKAIVDQPNSVFFLQAASNETGSILPIQEIRNHFPQILLFTDASQLLGKCPDFMDILEGIDGAVFSPHKFYGPKGIGVLNWSVRSGQLYPMVHGGGQESGFRSGTENSPLIYMTNRWFEMLPSLMNEWTKVVQFRNHFESAILSLVPESFVLGAGFSRLGNTSTICFPGVVSESSLAALDAVGIMASSGSACSSGTREPSQSYLSMGLSWEQARCVVRFSFGIPNLRVSPEILADCVGSAIKKSKL